MVMKYDDEIVDKRWIERSNTNVFEMIQMKPNPEMNNIFWKVSYFQKSMISLVILFYPPPYEQP